MRVILDSSFWDIIKSIAEQLAKAVAGNVFLSAIVLIVLGFLGAAVLLKQLNFLIAAVIFGVISILLIGALSFGASLPLWYAIVLIAAAAIGFAFAVVWWRTRSKPPNPTPVAVTVPTPPQNLDDKTIEAVTSVMRRAADDVATSLKIVKEKVRANVFAPTDTNSLKLVTRLAVGTNDPDELTLEIPIGTGVVGTAWKLRKQLWARFDPAALTQADPWYGIPRAQAIKVNKELKWVIALPTPPDECRFAWTVEGLVDRTDHDLDETIPRLAGWSYALDKYLKGVRLL